MVDNAHALLQLAVLSHQPPDLKSEKHVDMRGELTFPEPETYHRSSHHPSPLFSSHASQFQHCAHLLPIPRTPGAAQPSSLTHSASNKASLAIRCQLARTLPVTEQGLRVAKHCKSNETSGRECTW
jgi:hypothetical protein